MGGLGDSPAFVGLCPGHDPIKAGRRKSLRFTISISSGMDKG